MKLNWKRIAIAQSLIIVIALSAIGYVLSQPSSTFTISGGIYPGAPSYTVWSEGTNYYAKNANGLLIYEGTNASEAINDGLLEGGTVFLQDGIYNLSASILLQNRTRLLGESQYGTILRLEDSTTVTAMIQLQNYKTELTEIGYLMLDGNNATASGKGILLNNTAGGYGFSYDSVMHKIHDVYIQKFSDTGLYIQGDAREVQLRNVYSFWNEKYGFWLGGGDHRITDCNAGQNGYSGFVLAFGTIQMENCKAWGNGWDGSQSDRDGFLISGIVSGWLGFHSLSNIYAQDNYRHGVVLYNVQHVSISNVVAEANGVSISYSDGVKLDTVYNCTLTNIQSGNRAGYTRQDIGIEEVSPSNYNIIIGANTIGNNAYGILKNGTNTKVNLSYNLTTWIS